jgi:hypothetical protein
MRIKWLKIPIVLVIIMVSMISVVSACNCVDANGALSSSSETTKVAPYFTKSGNTIYFYLTTTFASQDIIGYCVYNRIPTSGLPSVSSNTEAVNYWHFKDKVADYVGFLPHPQGQHPLVTPQTNLPMGSVTFSSEPPDMLIILHVRSAELCGGNEQDGSPKTCHVRYGGNAIPEFPTVALPIAAVIGLVFFFQHKKRKEK